MVAITLCTRQQKRHWCIEQSFGLCGRGRGRGWDDLGEWHWNMYNIIYETNHQSRFNAWYWMLGAGALGQPRGMVRAGRREEGSGWGTCVYLWRIHVDIWQNQYNIVKLKKIKWDSHLWEGLLLLESPAHRFFKLGVMITVVLSTLTCRIYSLVTLQYPKMDILSLFRGGNGIRHTRWKNQISLKGWNIHLH